MVRGLGALGFYLQPGTQGGHVLGRQHVRGAGQVEAAQGGEGLHAHTARQVRGTHTHIHTARQVRGTHTTSHKGWQGYTNGHTKGDRVTQMVTQKVTESHKRSHKR